MNNILQIGYYESLLGFDKVDWFVNEVIKLDNKTAFDFKNTEKDIIMTQEDKEVFDKISNCRFCEKEIISDKIRDHCHISGKYRGPAHSLFKINVTQQQSTIISFIFHSFNNFDCHMFFKRLVELKNDKVKFKSFPKTKKDFISVSYGCIRFIDSYRFLSSSLDKLVKNLDADVFVILKKEFPDKWQYLKKN